MDSKLGHGLDLVKTQDQIYKEKFVSSLRAYVLNDLASDTLFFCPDDSSPVFL